MGKKNKKEGRKKKIVYKIRRGNNIPIIVGSVAFGVGIGWIGRGAFSPTPDGPSQDSVAVVDSMATDTLSGPLVLSDSSNVVTAPDTLTICSFNIQFLGNGKSRDNEALVDLVKGYDVVVVQELVSSPVDGTFPDGTSYSRDEESGDFVDAMVGAGFEYRLSSEDTGRGENNHTNSTATEWWITFYKPEVVGIAADLPTEFLAEDRTAHPDYERVPHSFAFRTHDNSLDFVLISVHLKPDKDSKSKARRKHELNAIGGWIAANSEVEKDFIILGDMNLYSPEEIADATPANYLSLNDEGRRTNTNITSKNPDDGALPYDHVMYHTEYTANNIDLAYDIEVIDLVEAMRPYWTLEEPYPGNIDTTFTYEGEVDYYKYNHNGFRKYYSDHHPVVFKMLYGQTDDD